MQFLTEKSEVVAWLQSHCTIIGDIHIHEDGRVDVVGSVEIEDSPVLAEGIRVKFNEVTEFEIRRSAFLTSLHGAPDRCQLFRVMNCDFVQSLEGGPQFCNTYKAYSCGRLATLKGAPQVCENFECTFCLRLGALDYCPNSKDLRFLSNGQIRITELPDAVEEFRYTITELQAIGLADYVNITRVPPNLSILTLPKMQNPTAAVFRQLLLQKVDLTLQRGTETSWLKALRSYRKTGDLLAMMVDFERLYGEPFYVPEIAPPETIPDILTETPLC